MQRREALAILAGATVGWPLAAPAQQKAMPVIGVLSARSSDQTPPPSPFSQGLRETGYVEGQNVAFERRYAEGHYDRLPALAADLVRRKVNVIVTDAFPSTRAAKNATTTIPIVFVVGVDPVGTGLVTNLARPDGNITGLTVFAGGTLGVKRFELLSELVPQARVIAFLTNPSNPASAWNVEWIGGNMYEVARAKGVQLHLLKAGSASEIDAAFTTLVELQAGGLIVSADPLFYDRKDQLVALAARLGVAAIYDARPFTAAGGLISYGAKEGEAAHSAGVYVGRILAGAKPADLPVQQPTRFELVINLKTAQALGLTVPQSLLARADEVIE
jgi:putative ABC transport system substrate-binding protein